MASRLQIALVVSATIPIFLAVFQRDTTLLVYTFFVAIFLARQRSPNLEPKVKTDSKIWFAFSVLMSGWLAEICAWTSNYLSANPNPALLSPQLFSDLILAIGYYGGWAIAWFIVTRWFSFTLRSVFLVTGIMGVFVEQNGSVALAIVGKIGSDPLGSVLLAIFVFAVYGSIMGASYLLAGYSWKQGGKESLIKYPLVIVLMFVLSAALFFLASTIGSSTGLVHSPEPIRQHPFFGV